MTFNRCAYAPCASLLRPDGPSLYWCNETCMTNWTKARNSALPLDPAGAEPPSPEPVPGATPTFVIVDEAAGIVASPELVAEAIGPASARIYREPAARLTEAAAIEVLAVTSDSDLARQGWLARALDRIRSVR